MADSGLTIEELVELRNAVRARMTWDDSITDDDLRKLIEDELFRGERARRMTAGERKAAVMRLYHSFRGLDALQPLLEDQEITEIMINSHREIFIEKRGELRAVDLGFESNERLEDLIQSIVGRVNRIVNEASPIVDARLPDGSRVHVVLPPIALKGPTVTIRRFPHQPLGIEDLIAKEAISREAAEFLRDMVTAKYNLFVSGGTGSGKTTFLNALSQWIPSHERVITIEDAAELQLRGIANLVSLETRNANSEGKGQLGIRELIRASLRMRPNRIIVGEVRGGEALDMLQAMNTGHEGSLSTGHANGAKDMISRLETMVLSGADLPVPVVRQQMASALDIVVHLSRFRDSSRRVSEICEVTGIEQGEVRLNTLFRFEEEGERDGRIVGSLLRVAPLRDTGKLRHAGLLKEEGG
ncbi:pilus assembly protein [Cohnella sp. CIP 111063]|uniref:CpaF family protein n=1 Tax=unclassified Cohnella TaxID=2636738 RepID=UPI000B8BF971|nr:MULTISPECIES: CpaF family protein [unclassified Cohnella]OXS58244.1 pilus assembly protein [Cohnella sp. CIP 111063]PRX71518.1 pilus assembly protein CpaF [Cohnella sp. SGD-V74]